jgi:transposase-like protein
LTEESKPDAKSVERQQRRSFSADEKLEIVMAAERPGATVSSVARAHGIVTGVLFRWRAELGFGRSARAKLAGVTVNNHASGHGAQQVVLHDILPTPDGMTTVELVDGRRMFAPEGSDVEDVRRHATTLGEA